MVSQNEAELIKQALQELSFSHPSPPKVVGWKFELGSDGAGDPAVFVTLMLDHATKEEDWTTEKLRPFMDQVRNAIFASGTGRWPYVRFGRQPELKAAG